MNRVYQNGKLFKRKLIQKFPFFVYNILAINKLTLINTRKVIQNGKLNDIYCTFANDFRQAAGIAMRKHKLKTFKIYDSDSS